MVDQEKDGLRRITFAMPAGEFEALETAAKLAGVPLDELLRESASTGFGFIREEIRQRFGYGEKPPTEGVDLSQVLPGLEVVV